MQHRILASVLVVILVVGITGCSSLRKKGEEKEVAQSVSLTQVPEAARAQIEKLTAGGQIRKLEKAEEGGQTVYDVEATVQGREVEYDVAADGTVLTSGMAVPFNSLPIAVRAAAEEYFGMSPALRAFAEVEQGKTFYEVEGKKGRARITLKLTDTGQIVEEERE